MGRRIVATGPSRAGAPPSDLGLVVVTRMTTSFASSRPGRARGWPGKSRRGSEHRLRPG
jgi:hypothetical protein